MVPEHVLSGAVLTVLVVLDLHNGYWSSPVRAGVRISKGWLLTALRVAESVAALAFFYRLSESMTLGMTVSVALSVAAAAGLSLAMYKKDLVQRRIVALGLYEARVGLDATIRERLDAHVASLKQGQDRFLAAQEKAIKEIISGANVLGREARALLDETKRRSDELGFVTPKLMDLLQRLYEKEEVLDLMRNELEMQQEAGGVGDAGNERQRASVIQASSRLTSEDGRANRIKGLDAQKELADIIRGWGLAVRVGYSKGVPDFKVMRDDELVAVIACKAFTLSEGGTKQRRVAKDDIIAELKYSRSKQVSLVIAVKNLISGRWWMHWVSVRELAEFDGVSTPVILAEDGGEAVNILTESVKGVREKLLGTA